MTVLPAQFKTKSGKPLQTLDNKSTLLKQLKILLSEFMSGNTSKSVKYQIRSFIQTMLSKNIISLDTANVIENALKTSMDPNAG